jgi:dinuclear metal center YbgI/SA1388 family protein
MPNVSDVCTLLDRHFPPETAEDWDSVGLICGDPSATVKRILFALDPTLDVIHEAIDVQADLVVTHHPLFLTGVHAVARNTLGGRVVHEAISHGIALFNAHTNADHANPGVSDALAAALGLVECAPIQPADTPLTGAGRIGRLPKTLTLAQFAQHVADSLPKTAGGIRVAGDSDKKIDMVAVCGGSGDFLLPLAATLADVYVTSDLKHHRVLDHPRDECALIDAPHMATEWPWVLAVAALVQTELGASVSTLVSSVPTDPWTGHHVSTAG